MLIHDATYRGAWNPFAMGRKEVPSHLLFADDILLFGETSQENIWVLKEVFDQFCQISGQSISEEKK